MKTGLLKRMTVVFALMAWIFILSACNSSEEQNQSTESDFVSSNLARKTTPVVDDTDMMQLISDNNAFAFDLYQKMRTDEGNLFYSPFSISMALAMTYAGARENTAAEMAHIMRYGLSPEKLHPAFNKIDLEINSRGENVKKDEGTAFTLNVVNAIWGQKGKSWLQNFLDTLAVNYGAGLRILDFIADAAASRKTINDWVAEQTEQKIKDLLPEDSVTVDTRMVLTNAIYFKASWMHQFDKSQTKDGVFTLLNGSTITGPMMNQTAMFLYADGEGYIALSLPYVGNDLSMIILMPDEGNFNNFENRLTLETLGEIKSAFSYTNIKLSFPRFEFEDPTGLKDILTSMGMKLAFSPTHADFSGIDGTKTLYISDVLHKAFVNVNEEGTEATAATAVGMGITSMPPPPIEAKINRPFIFLIQDKTGAILFAGRVVNPKS
ncbi:MAG: serpin family protein [Deltaproteobacteria bacterium]|nr:serpin family protein [Deltaproteobacteria bacterium]